MKYEIKNWSEFQQYKDDRPLHWIKLHVSLLADYAFNQLPEIDQLHLVKLWMVAAKHHGRLEGDEKWLAKLINTKKLNINNLLQAGFIVRTDSYETVPREEESRVEEIREEKRRGDAAKLPEWVNSTAWLEFEEHRKNIRKPLSDLARSKAVNQLKGFTLEEQQTAIDTSIQSSWAGIFPKKLNGANNETNQRSNRPESNLARMSRKLQADIAAE
ncbi:MAG: hypothetical protein GY941_12120 [Planctomycetes bacterium]|nr:hypothetical protein [Planctomycetota bacterium]